VLVAPDGRVFGFTVTVLERRRALLDAQIVEWREFVLRRSPVGTTISPCRLEAS
jgi:hypothetical protein